ncbi:MAG: hypothetical protein ACJ79K_03680 [Gemmatimonadaceae bacterium]
MLDDLNPQGGRGESQAPKRAREERPLTDREVPLGQARNMAPIHAWLDGELPESAVRTAESARDVDFWRKVTEETERRRTMKTPAYLEAQIMAALPTDRTADGVQTWWAREVTMTPATAAVAAASLLAVGAAATVAVLRAIR